MDDLLTLKGQEDALKYFNYLKLCVDKDIYYTREINIIKNDFIYHNVAPIVEKSTKNDTVILTNCDKDDINLLNMINEFINLYPYKTRIVNINDFNFSGGCLGCLNCAFDGKCVYKDGFDNYLRSEIQNAKAIVYAATIKDHSLGASFKLYDDRQFCNGHRAVTMGMPIGYILSGIYSCEGNLRIIIEGRANVGHNFLSGIASDESHNNKEILLSIKRLSDSLIYSIDNKMLLPQNFLGIGGMKIFRDLIYLMQGMMKADHKFYKEHNFYDFPQKKKGMKLKMKLIGFLMSKPKIRKKVQ
jgi:hypothetical protein